MINPLEKFIEEFINVTVIQLSVILEIADDFISFSGFIKRSMEILLNSAAIMRVA